MRLNAVKVLGISITNTSKKEILEEIQKYLFPTTKNRQKPLVIFTPNTEQLVLAHKNPSFAEVMNRADIMLPDTVGVVWGSRILTKTCMTESIPGVEFMESLIEMAGDRHVLIGLIGGRGNLAVQTLDCLRQKYGILQDSLAEDGPEVEVRDGALFVHSTKKSTDEYFQNLAKRIIDAQVKIVFVALGPPKQEYFIETLARALGSYRVVLMAVGGSFDIISGRLKRAPVWMRHMGLEWFWRLLLEPWRIRRQFALVEFVFLVLRASFHNHNV
jgi:N-acetylglucosaminyldiphosphoundecaprenol N-acetyl-beta-D-mannosaminyltransferase